MLLRRINALGNIINLLIATDFCGLMDTLKCCSGVAVYTYRKGPVYRFGRRWEVQSRIAYPGTMETSTRFVPTSVKDRVNVQIRVRPP